MLPAKKEEHKELSVVRPFYSLSQMDAIEWMKQIDDESVDCIITDPPYESLEKHRKSGTTTRLKMSKSSSNEWFDIFHNDRFPELFEQAYRVLKPNSHLYIFCDTETMFAIKPMGEAAGFKFWKNIIWHKVTIGLGFHYRNTYENILFFEKGKRRLKDLSIPDVLSYKRIKGKDKYPTQKPSELSDILLRQSGEPQGLVIDPFCGSSPVGESALKAGMYYMGCDTSERAIQISKERLDALSKL